METVRKSKGLGAEFLHLPISLFASLPDQGITLQPPTPDGDAIPEGLPRGRPSRRCEMPMTTRKILADSSH
jgi:hypothetical protein